MLVNEINGLYIGRNLDQKFNVLIAVDDLAMAKKIAKNYFKDAGIKGKVTVKIFDDTTTSFDCDHVLTGVPATWVLHVDFDVDTGDNKAEVYFSEKEVRNAYKKVLKEYRDYFFYRDPVEEELEDENGDPIADEFVDDEAHTYSESIDLMQTSRDEDSIWVESCN